VDVLATYLEAGSPGDPGGDREVISLADLERTPDATRVAIQIVANAVKPTSMDCYRPAKV